MLRSALFWLFFPVIVFQGLRLRKTAPILSGAAGPASGTIGSGPSYRLIGIGDSIISGVGASTLERALVGRTARKLSRDLNGRIHWTAHGSIGARTDRVLNRLIPGLGDTPADFMVVSVGVNDITGLSRVSQWKKNLDAILNGLRRHSPGAITAVSGIPPLWGFPLLPQPLRFLMGMRGNMFDRAGRRVVANHSLAVHVPVHFDPRPEMFSPDGYHPSEKSYHEFGNITGRLLVNKYRMENPNGL